MLSGELLVDGSPLDRPPGAYSEQSLFPLLFGGDVVEVVPTSAMSGFSFSLLRKFEGLTIYLGMASDSQKFFTRLRVRATDGTKMYETIPAELFRTRYPTHFVKDYVHWYDFQSKAVAFRPASTPWDARSPAIWSMSKCENGNCWHLIREGETVSGLESPLCQAVASVLAPLGINTEIHVLVRRHWLGCWMSVGCVRAQGNEVWTLDRERLGMLVGVWGDAR